MDRGRTYGAGQAEAAGGRPHLLGLVPEAIAATLREAGVEVTGGEARRLLVHAAAPGGRHAAARRPLARRLLRAVDERFDVRRPEVVDRVADPADGFVRYVFRAADGAPFEAVRIPLHRRGRFSVCLSSQVGCAMRCDFCATGRLGLSRNLDAGEIVGSYLAVRDDAECEGPGAQVTGALFMGQGEPFHNYDQVIRAARVLSHPCGGRIAAGAITISTVGLVPAIRRYTREGHAYRLIVSLTSAVESRRRRLLPVVARRWTVEETAAAIREHAAATGSRVTVAWVVMGGVNTGDDEVAALERLFRDVPVRLNLIDVNDARPGGYRRAGAAELDALRDRLRRLGVPVVRRYSGGAGRHAACGMLTNRSRTTPASDTPPGPRGGPIEVEHDTGRHPRSPTGCPVCDGALVHVECKLVCTRCHRIVENASGD